ncbi:MAG: extracellular solute-binding protein [Anaerolineae bacterium]|nr:extracellular solute-binding protein [Anaerolineae bacterium]
MSGKRWFMMLSLLTIVSLLLVACRTPATPEAPATEETGDVIPAEEEITLTIWDFGGVDFQWMDDLIIPAYQETHPNIKFEHLGVPEDDLGLKLETAIAAGEVPDLAVFVPARLAKAGHILELTNLMEAAGLKTSDFCPLFESRDMLDGKVYSLPITANWWGMMYNKDLFAAAGLPELGVDDVIDMQTWLEYAQALNKPAEDLADRVWGSNLFFPIWNSMGNELSDPFVLGSDGRQCLENATTDDWLAAWTAMKTAWDEDLTTWSAGAMLADIEEDMFRQGKIAMTEATMGDAVAAREGGINVGITGQPVIGKDVTHNVGGWNVSYSILAGSEHPEEAFEFLKFLAVKGALMLAGGSVGEASGVPCYMPVAEEFVTAFGGDELISQSLALLARISPPPFTPDIWTSVDPFNEAWRVMTEDNGDIKGAVEAAAAECQEVTDGLWEQWDSLSQ